MIKTKTVLIIEMVLGFLFIMVGALFSITKGMPDFLCVIIGIMIMLIACIEKWYVLKMKVTADQPGIKDKVPEFIREYEIYRIYYVVLCSFLFGLTICGYAILNVTEIISDPFWMLFMMMFVVALVAYILYLEHGRSYYLKIVEGIDLDIWGDKK